MSSPATPRPVAPPELLLRLSLDELNLVLEAVGQLPYARVFTLVARLQGQAAEQLQAAASATPQPAP